MSRGTGTVYAAILVLIGLGLLHNQRRVFDLLTSPEADIYSTIPPGKYDTLKQPFSWDKVSAHKELKWYDCYEKRECARLLVPMNYSEPDGEQYSIALVRKPAVVPPESEFYRGPILFNPGGPGGSGVDMIRGPRGEQFASILGPQFDILGFDPRGISRSTPRASFFETGVERELWERGTDTVNISDVPRIWARARVIGQLAGETDTGYLRHINTENTARDMLSIVEAHRRSKLQFWGFSYGSVLGATFAALFPDRIERLIIDGVLDSEGYYASSWANSLRDTERAMESFYRGCAAAGPDGCAFWAPTAEDIRQNLMTLYDSLRTNPMPIRTTSGYGLLDFNKLYSAIFTALYKPYEAFPVIAQGLANIASGSGKLIFDRMNPPVYECACDSPEGAFTSVVDSQLAVLCNDGIVVLDDLKHTQQYYAEMKKISPFWGEYFAASRATCVGWPKYPKDHFQGPFVANTSHPILLIGNTADPVTPLWSAKKMSKGFKGSVVLTQDSVGHGSISAPSLCTQKYVRDYFIDGTLPQPGTICLPLAQPFPSAGTRGSIDEEQKDFSSSLAEQDREILEGILELSKDPGIVPIHGNILL